MTIFAQLARLDTVKDGGSLSETSSTTSSPKGTGFFLPLTARFESKKSRGGKGTRGASRRSEDANPHSSQLRGKSTKPVTGIDASSLSTLSNGCRNSVTMLYHPEGSVPLFAEGRLRAIHAGPAPPCVPGRQGVRRGSLDSCYFAARTGSPIADDQGYVATPASHLTGSVSATGNPTSSSLNIGYSRGQAPSFNQMPLPDGLQRSVSASATFGRTQQCLSPASAAAPGPAAFRTINQFYGSMDVAATAANGAASAGMQFSSAASMLQLEQQQVLQLQQQLDFLRLLQQQQQQEQENAQIQAELELELQLVLQLQQQEEEQQQHKQALAQFNAAGPASFQQDFTNLPAMLQPQSSLDSPFVTAVAPSAAAASSSPYPPQLVSSDSTGYLELSGSSSTSSGSITNIDFNGKGFMNDSTGSLFSDPSLNWAQGTAALAGAGFPGAASMGQAFPANNQLLMMQAQGVDVNVFEGDCMYTCFAGSNGPNDAPSCMTVPCYCL